MKEFITNNTSLLLISLLFVPLGIAFAIREYAWLAVGIWGAAEIGLLYQVVDLYKRQVKNKQND